MLHWGLKDMFKFFAPKKESWALIHYEETEVRIWSSAYGGRFLDNLCLA